MWHPESVESEGGATASVDEKQILRVFDCIHANPAGDPSLDALADIAAIAGYGNVQTHTQAFRLSHRYFLVSNLLKQQRPEP